MNNFCNVPYMPIFEGKRLEFVGVKFNESEKNKFEEIATEEDRALSYVVRELALRGLVQFLQDGNLKTTNQEIELAKKYLNGIKESNNQTGILTTKLKVGQQNKSKKADAA